jgi:hypothetical protein
MMNFVLRIIKFMISCFTFMLVREIFLLVHLLHTLLQLKKTSTIKHRRERRGEISSSVTTILVLDLYLMKENVPGELTSPVMMTNQKALKLALPNVNKNLDFRVMKRKVKKIARLHVGEVPVQPPAYVKMKMRTRSKKRRYLPLHLVLAATDFDRDSKNISTPTSTSFSLSFLFTLLVQVFLHNRGQGEFAS